MPIRINLLAEAQAAEESRRRDPVKRAVIIAGCLVAMVMVWISSLELKIMADNARLGNLEHTLNSRTNEYNRVLNSEKQLDEVNGRLKALHRLASERLLNATLLNSLMLATVDGIQITRFNTEQNYELTPEVKPVQDHGRNIPGRPAAAVEKVRLLLSARDSSPNPGGEQISKFKNALVHTAYFQSRQISTNNVLLKNLLPAQMDDKTGKMYVAFSLECNYPDRVR